MPKLSKAAATNVQDHGMAVEYRADLDGYTTSFLEIRADVDLAPVLKGLPDDRCTCPHWGYLIKGRMVWTFADHQEVYEAGDAFYVPPGHTPFTEAGSEFVMFSPAEQLAPVEAVMTANMQALQSASTPARS
jgi:hypothetical protein